MFLKCRRCKCVECDDYKANNDESDSARVEEYDLRARTLGESDLSLVKADAKKISVKCEHTDNEHSRQYDSVDGQEREHGIILLKIFGRNISCGNKLKKLFGIDL